MTISIDTPAPVTVAAPNAIWTSLTVASLAKSVGMLTERHAANPTLLERVTAVGARLEAMILSTGDYTGLMDLTREVDSLRHA